MYRDPLMQAFWTQRRDAGRRGIPWLFSFEEWLAMWERSGHLADRGSRRGQFVMARRGDVGPYAVWNVDIVPAERNASDARANNPDSQRLVAHARTGSGRGWTMRRGRFQVYIAKRYVGIFATAELADAAYARASAEHRSSLGVN